jgi:hypothetical protein
VWRRVARGIYASADVSESDVQRVDLVSRSAGRNLVVVGRSAALLHGFGVLDSSVVHVAGGPRKTARTWPGLQLHGYKLASADVMHIGEMVVTTPDRTVVDLARSVERIDALPVIDAALGLGVCTTETLAAQLDRQRGSRGIVRARHLIQWGNGAAESPMESRARLRVLDSRLPPPQVQWWVLDAAGHGKYRLDLAWPDVKVALEYDGVDHLDRPRQRLDLERRAWLAAAGWRVLWVTDLDIYRHYDRMLGRLDQFIVTSRDHAQTALSTGVSRAVSA